MKETILCVGTDHDVVAACQRHLPKHYHIEAVRESHEGIVALRTRSSFAVLVADLDVLRLDAVPFLHAAHQASPESLCLLLTDGTAPATLMAAVNAGHPLRFLAKPCSNDVFLPALDHALEHYHQATAHQHRQAALRAGEARYRVLVENTVQGLCIHRYGQILFINPAMSRLFGYTQADDLLGQDLRALLPKHEAMRMESYWNTHLRSETVATRYEFQARRQDGTPLWLESLLSSLLWEGQPALLETVTDITQRKDANRLQEELISTVRHDLRAPLTGLRGFTELMLRYEYPPEKRRKFLTILREEGIRLTTLLDNFLDLQRIEAGRQVYHFGRVEVAPFLRATVGVYEQEETLPTFTCEVSPHLPPVRADAERLRQVLVNLLSNAVRFSPYGGNIRVGARQDGDQMLFWVSDQGVGIPDSVLHKLFSKFYHLDQTIPSQHGGTGLGLALVKEILEAHHGRIWVESTVGQGSTFWFTLPLAEVEEPLQWLPASAGTFFASPPVFSNACANSGSYVFGATA